MTGYSRRNGAYMTKEDKRVDLIKGIKKYMAVGKYDAVLLRERELMNEYGMTAEEIEEAIFA